MTITFVLMNAIPGDPLDSEKFLDVTLKQAMLAKYGLDRPLYERYLKYLADYLHGDFGISYIKVGLSTNEIIAAGFPYSLRIGIYSSVLHYYLRHRARNPGGARQNKFVDRFLMVLSTLGSTIPVLCLRRCICFIQQNPGACTGLWSGKLEGIHRPCPGFTSVFSMAFVTRLMRTSMIEELNQDYIRTARAKRDLRV